MLGAQCCRRNEGYPRSVLEINVFENRMLRHVLDIQCVIRPIDDEEVGEASLVTLQRSQRERRPSLWLMDNFETE